MTLLGEARDMCWTPANLKYWRTLMKSGHWRTGGCGGTWFECASLERELAAGTVTGEDVQPPGHPSVSLMAFPHAEGCQPKATLKSPVLATIDNMLVDLWPLTDEKLQEFKDETEFSAAPTAVTRKVAMASAEA